jgi:Type IV secretion system pilin
MKPRNILALFAAIICTLPPVAFAASCGGDGTGIQNPLSSAYCTIPAFIAGFLQVMVEIGLPIVALFLLIAGYQFIAAGGNPDKLAKAKENFVYVIIGMLLILGAWVIATLIGNTVSQVVGNGV